MRIINSFNDLDLTERLYPHCMHCNHTGDALDADKFKKRFGKDVPLELIKILLVCKLCGKSDEIILRVISNEAIPMLGQQAL